MLIGLVSHYFFGISIFLTSVFLILLVLVQRGRGGGIAGALGGAGGQSAFGTKAGDFFTRLTVGVAAFWIILCIGAIKVLKSPTFSTGLTKNNSSIRDSSGSSPTATGSGANTGASSAPTGSGDSSQAEVGGAIDLKKLDEFNPAAGSSNSPAPAEDPAGTSTPPAAESPTGEATSATIPPTTEAGAGTQQPESTPGDGASPDQPK